MKFLVAAVLFLSLNQFAMGADIQALERPYAKSCGYFSHAGVEIRLYFSDPSLPQEAQVNLIYGLGSKTQNRDWEGRQVLPTIKAGLSNTRQALFSVALAQRSYPEQYDLLQFVWEIKLPNGHTYYDNGGESAWGFYQANVSTSASYACNPVDQFKPLEFYKVNRY